MRRAIISSGLGSGMPVIMPTFNVIEKDENGIERGIPCNLPELSLEKLSDPKISSLIKGKDDVITIEGDYLAINGTTTDIPSKTLKMYLEDIASEKHDIFELKV